ncbi:MAG: methyltransferase domain-containing protein [Myxococcales bacterium]|nr:methyltransferase domain-containing protein [Myxococcota bacterium]MDW8282686.1 methyltransferase domain-containing protein [Myxococcales bacterium]
MSTPSVTDMLQSSMRRDEVQQRVEQYLRLHDDRDGGGADRRKADYATMINDYYDLATDFYEFGWGQSFHFAPRSRGESLAASLVRHEHFLALRLGLRPGMRVVDLGCGVGGPMRNIARFSGATIVGVNNNAYQIRRGTRQTEEARLSHLCSFVQSDFLHLPMPDETFDAAYAIEAICHAPDKRQAFAEILRVLKRGALFACYDWCLTARYDPANPAHREIKKGIEEGNALPDIATIDETLAAVREAGFELLAAEDRADASDPETPWYLPLADTRWYTFSGFRASRPGRWLTHQMVRLLEAVRIAPRGATAVSSFLERGARALVAGGKAGVFTPLFYFEARRPA